MSGTELEIQYSYVISHYAMAHGDGLVRYLFIRGD